MENKNTFNLIYEEVKKIPKGKVASYGYIAKRLGRPRLSRVVGYALHVNPDPDTIPCHRVVTKDGQVSKAFAFGGLNKQIELLEKEGIKLKDGKVDMSLYALKEVPWDEGD